MFVYLSIGSNIAPESNMIKVFKCLIKDFGQITILPPIYTQPYEINSRNIFINSIAVIQTNRELSEIKKITNSIEQFLGRDKTDRLSYKKDREADIDILEKSVTLSFSSLKQSSTPYLREIFERMNQYGDILLNQGLPSIGGPTTIDIDARTSNIIIVH